MSIQISEELKRIIQDKSSLKILGTVDGKGVPHLAGKGSIDVDEEGTLYYLELLEGSLTNKNMIRSLWFNKPVAILVVSGDRRSFHILAKPVKTLVANHVFEKYYELAQSRNPDNDLAAVYYFDVLEVRESGYAKRKQEEEALHPLYEHLDRRAVNR
ncbi:MAG: hypothetical protein LBP30_07170 [Clostridiales Family XIII bacterium]|jgi:hypothetical protein|nr:hypothetical protein [Clostridiales Family XIII bacterium]